MSEAILIQLIVSGTILILASIVGGLIYRTIKRAQSGQNEYERHLKKIAAEKAQREYDISTGKLKLLHTPGKLKLLHTPEAE